MMFFLVIGVKTLAEVLQVISMQLYKGKILELL
ncbi:hypothetical protein Pint_04585 [Pistacia integerrima]|uniref:Uncharacterized protein n=1 Tax=Pistacia integerrima TaxID=434235 RepID=A0ACC0Z6B9_9ROSI|nr:hypothetical protein Pint_04585 [Pistacia integerrima]